jgi:hypothetical protein
VRFSFGSITLTLTLKMAKGELKKILGHRKERCRGRGPVIQHQARSGDAKSSSEPGSDGNGVSYSA